MKKITFILAFSSLFINSFCQNNYKPGYILKNSGDTIYVQLQEENTGNLQLKVKYKKNGQNAEISSANPGEIKGFGYTNGSLYQSAQFSEDTFDSTAVRQYFVKQLLSGAFDLFVYNKADQYVYIIYNEGERFLLTNTIYTANGEIKKEGNFKNQLYFLCRQCDALKKDIDLIEFNEQRIVEFVTQLNRCASPGEPIISYYHKQKNEINVITFAGALPVKGSVQVNAEIIARWYLSKIIKNFSLNVGIHYSNVPSGISSDVNRNDPLWKYRRKDGFFSFPVVLQYHLSLGKFYPYVGVGFSIVHWDQPYTYYQTNLKFTPVGVTGIAEIGVECMLTKYFLIKAAWRYEELIQYPALGIAVKF